MNLEDWDGIERREPRLVAERFEKARAVEVPLMAVIVGFASIGLLMAGLLWALIVHAGSQRSAGHDAEEFRAQLSCYVIQVSQGKPAGDVLNDCGFLNIKGTR